MAKKDDGNEGLLNFMMDVAGDEKKKQALMKDPDSVLKSHNLPENVKASIKEAIKTKKADPVLKHISAAEKQKHGNVQVNCII